MASMPAMKAPETGNGGYWEATAPAPDGPFAGASVWDRITNAVEDVGDFVFGASEPPAMKQAGRQITSLTKLPPDQQAAAIAKMSAAEFNNMLSNADYDDKERMKSLVENTTDPERKLELWGAYHKAHASLGVFQYDDKDLDSAERERQKHARQLTSLETHSEVNDEMLELRGRKGGFTAADVDALMQRKSLEHDIEMRHATNLTSSTTHRDAKHPRGEHIHWDVDELQVMDRSLAQVPKEHLAGVTEFHRTNIDPDNPEGGGGWHGPSTGRVAITDFGVDNQWPLTRQKREHADEHDIQASENVRPLEEVVLHEIGHSVHHENTAAFEKYSGLQGWKPQGLGEVATIPGAIPGPRTEGGEAPYDYGKKNRKEMFAEHYTMAVNTPEQVHADFVEGPSRRAADAEKELRALQAERDKDLAKPKPGWNAARWKAELKQHEDRVARARAEQDVRRQEFDIMRNDVFHTNKAQAQAEQRLAAQGLDEKQLEAFRSRAATASTPAQLKRLEADAFRTR